MRVLAAAAVSGTIVRQLLPCGTLKHNATPGENRHRFGGALVVLEGGRWWSAVRICRANTMARRRRWEGECCRLFYGKILEETAAGSWPRRLCRKALSPKWGNSPSDGRN